MAELKLRGVIAAVATPVNEDGSPDIARATKLARYLIDNGCDGLNVLGTTGEATSFSLDERKRVMDAYKAAGLPLDRMMVGTGAAAVADAVALTRHAAELGFAGALVLPPFYYKGVPDDGLVAYIDTIVKATAQKPVPIYLYHYPQQSGLHWHVALVKRLLDTFGSRIVGLKDSSGDMNYAREAAAISKSFDVFPSTEAVLLDARAGAFAGCISATANLNSDLCQLAWTQGRQGRARCRGHHPQAVRRQAARLRREGAARAHPRRSGAGADEAAARAVLRRRSRWRGRGLRPGARQARRVMASKNIRIAIIGGGIGGLTTAISLLQAGFDVQVYEQSRLLSEVGAGINISPNASRILTGVSASATNAPRWRIARRSSISAAGTTAAR